VSIDETFAAIDVGSNSFHMIVAKTIDEHQFQVIDRLREPVRLAAGLDGEGNLSPEALTRGLDCLQRFGQRLREVAPSNARAVGTNALRRARDAGAFLRAARLALGHRIEVVSGAEEARLIYLGVAHSSSVAGPRLVLDIGGGSTELILGEGFEPRRLESLYLGCVSMSERYFPDGVIDKGALQRAEMAARLELEPVRWGFTPAEWGVATGASGTIRAIWDIVTRKGWSDEAISRESLKQLRLAMLDAGHADQLPARLGVNADRAPVLAGGLAILLGVFKSLGIQRMEVSDGALREGLLLDLMGRVRHEDVRTRTVQTIEQRYAIDYSHAHRVAATANRLLREVRKDWVLHDEDFGLYLTWAAALHELGLLVAHSHHHKHGAYILENADLPGFSRWDQRLLSALVRGHRGKFPTATFADMPDELRQPAERLCILLRLAVALQRGRGSTVPPPVRARALGQHLELEFPEDWLENNPLTRADLEQESRYLQAAGYQLDFAPELATA
jgi:exopolyphosphatase/guanosine-5'-triphosphate,3'-diphosphate pyrophosphatase